jgi:hypothetical protein
MQEIIQFEKDLAMEMPNFRKIQSVEDQTLKMIYLQKVDNS